MVNEKGILVIDFAYVLENEEIPYTEVSDNIKLIRRIYSK